MHCCGDFQLLELSVFLCNCFNHKFLYWVSEGYEVLGREFHHGLCVIIGGNVKASEAHSMSKKLMESWKLKINWEYEVLGNIRREVIPH